MLFKIIFALSSVLSSSELVSDGWYPVPRPKKEVLAEGADERDLSVWVVFSKQIGSERFLVSLPKEPSYKYMKADGSEMEVFSSSENMEFRLQVMNKIYDHPDDLLKGRLREAPGAILVGESQGEGSSPYSELVYWQSGYWVHERVVVTSERTYFFQMKSVDLSNDAYQQFVSSFSIENRK